MFDLIRYNFKIFAGVVELVDTLDLGSSAARCESSSLSVRTILSPQGDLSCCYTYVFLIKDKRGRHYGRRFS